MLAPGQRIVTVKALRLLENLHDFRVQMHQQVLLQLELVISGLDVDIHPLLELVANQSKNTVCQIATIKFRKLLQLRPALLHRIISETKVDNINCLQVSKIRHKNESDVGVLDISYRRLICKDETYPWCRSLDLSSAKWSLAYMAAGSCKAPPS